MSTPLPLSVRLVTSRRDQLVTKDLRDAPSFAAAIPGGFTSCTISLSRPLRWQPDEIVIYGRLIVYDTRTAMVLWEGEMQDPGRTAGSDGEVYDIAAVGGWSHTEDESAPYIIVDRAHDQYEKTSSSTQDHPSGSYRSGDEVGGDQSEGLWVSLPPGTDIVNNSRIGASYFGLSRAGQNLAVVDYAWDAGQTNASWRVRALTDGGWLIRDQAFNVAGGAASARVTPTNWPLGETQITFMIQWTAGSTSDGTSDNTWAFFDDVVVVATRFDRDGNEITTGYTNADETVLASTIAEDALGRILSDVYDGTNATIDTTTYQIEQFAYHDPVTARQIFENLATFEPGFYPAVWEKNTTGKYTFEYRAWPTTVGLEAPIAGGFTGPGSGGELYDKARVRYVNKKGQPTSFEFTSPVQALTDAGFHRTIEVDLGTEDGATFTQAQQAADQALAEHATVPNAGSLTITGPIIDHTTGRMLYPQELVRWAPGKLLRARDLNPRVDALNPVGRDGQTVFKVVAAAYRDGATQLDLDAFSYSAARTLGLQRTRKLRGYTPRRK